MLEKTNYLLFQVSDFHCGSTVGLYPCDAVIENSDGNAYGPSIDQETMWNFTRETLRDIVDFKRQEKNAKIITIEHGDLIEGFHHGSVQTMSPDELVMKDIGFETIKEFADISDYIALLAGTGSHVGENAKLEEDIARRLQAFYPKKFIKPQYRYTWPVFEQSFNGRLYNGIHTGSVGRTAQSRFTPLIKKANEQIAYRRKRHMPIPDFYVSGHAHLRADTKNLLDETRVQQLACMKLTDTYGNEKCPNTAPDLGYQAIYIRWDGTCEFFVNDFYAWLRKKNISLRSEVRYTKEEELKF